jgi:hypothetical protein
MQSFEISECSLLVKVKVKVKIKVKVTLEQATKAQRGSRGLYLYCFFNLGVRWCG